MIWRNIFSERLNHSYFHTKLWEWILRKTPALYLQKLRESNGFTKKVDFANQCYGVSEFHVFHTLRVCTYISYLLWSNFSREGNKAVQRSKFHIEGLRLITDRRSTNTDWSFKRTACSTAVLASLFCHIFWMISIWRPLFVNAAIIDSWPLSIDEVTSISERSFGGP